MPIQGQKFTIQSNQETHQVFQSTNSFVAYNPNDGIAHIALDRTATLLDWDHRLPSQSGGKFPGPVNSYLSIYYVDQSGSGASGLITVYGSMEQLQIPYFWSIGRALQTLSTSMDITNGSQPANPPAGVNRLWSDNTGTKHHLNSSGSDLVIIDTGNIGSQPLGGGLVGSIGNGSIANGGINLATMFANGVVSAAALAAGVAASNVGALGGHLAGTLPNPALASGAAFANLGAGSISNIQSAAFGGGISTASTTLVGTSDTFAFNTPALTTIVAVALMPLNIPANAVVAAAIRDTSQGVQMPYPVIVANGTAVVRQATLVAVYMYTSPNAVTSHTLETMWSTTVGTVTQASVVSGVRTTYALLFFR